MTEYLNPSPGTKNHAPNLGVYNVPKCLFHSGYRVYFYFFPVLTKVAYFISGTQLSEHYTPL